MAKRFKTITSKQYQAKFAPKKLSEEQEQAKLCDWLKLTYPNVLYTIDLGGVKMDARTAARVMKTRSKKGHPDMMIQEWFLDKYCGLAIEFKRTGEVVQNKDGSPRKTDHLKSQMEYILALKDRCWVAGFVCGIENAKAVITAYLEGNAKSLETINKYIYPTI